MVYGLVYLNVLLIGVGDDFLLKTKDIVIDNVFDLKILERIFWNLTSHQNRLYLIIVSSFILIHSYKSNMIFTMRINVVIIVSSIY